MASLKYWLWLTQLHSMTPAQILAVLRHFGTPEGAYFADPGEYQLVEGLTGRARKALEDKRLAGAELILEECEKLGLSLLTIQDAQYPDCLKNIPDPPALLYYKGKLPSFDEVPTIGVVGTRSCTPYGEKVAAKLGLDLARAGAVLVSGIAEGIDGQAIRGALAGGGTVVSVLGGGIDVKYPACNRYLYDDVAAAGALISEYPPGTRPLGTNFPVRNRIISGLSDGVVAVESGERGGTLITMNQALEQSRDTFAVPGPVDAPESAGTNRLIRDGCAKLITCAEDVLVEYADRYPVLRRARPSLTPQAQAQRLESVMDPGVREQPAEKKEVDKRTQPAYIDWKSARDLFSDDERDMILALEGTQLTADELVERTQIPAKRVLSALTILQVRGYAQETPGHKFAATVQIRPD